MAKWYPLDGFRCPVTGCKGQENEYDWVCFTCQTKMYVAQTGLMRCSDGIHNAHVCQWKFDCGNHSDHPAERWRSADKEGFCFALSHAIQLTSAAGATWVAALCVEIGKQYDHS